MANTTKILFLASEPTDISRICLGKELREIDERIQLGDRRDQLELIPHFAARPRDLIRGLLLHKPHVLHFSGHGSPTEGIVLEDDHGQTRLVSADALADLFATIKDNLRLVVLNACYSGLQAQGITEVVDCMIGMQKAIGDKSAIVFSAAFYQALAFGRNLQESFGTGVSALKMEYPSESSIPSMMTKRDVAASQIYLTSQRSKQPNKPKPPSDSQNVDIAVKDSTLKPNGSIEITGIHN
jgi:hypothetical protein